MPAIGIAIGYFIFDHQKPPIKLRQGNPLATIGKTSTIVTKNHVPIKVRVIHQGLPTVFRKHQKTTARDLTPSWKDEINTISESPATQIDDT